MGSPQTNNLKSNIRSSPSSIYKIMAVGNTETDLSGRETFGPIIDRKRGPDGTYLRKMTRNSSMPLIAVTKPRTLT